ncbi:MAG: sodium:solute symporter family transporter [Thermoguttaceae bacterium]
MYSSAFELLDYVVIAVYLLGITGLGIWIGFRRHASSEQYFLASKSLGWFTVGAAVFASNISTIHLVGLAADGARIGLVVGNFEWMACYTLILLALVFAPYYLRTQITTLPEFLEKRFGPPARTILAIIGILAALLIHIGISMFTAAKLFESFLGIPMIASILVISLLTVTYTALGGLKAVVVTETIQLFLLLGSAVMVTGLSIAHLPEMGIHDIAAFKAQMQPDQLNMVQTIAGPDGNLREFSWLGIVLGFPILGIWYWCTDQTHVQRVLGARSEKEGQNGALFAGFLKLLPVFLMVFPGTIGYIMYRKGELNLGAAGNPDYNLLLAQMIQKLVPVGLKGLVAAGMVAALMSCMAAALNSCATLISVDIVKRLRPGMPDTRVVTIGRVTTGIIMLLAMAWSTQGGQFGTIFQAINKIPMTFAPAVTTIFLFGLLWKRGDLRAALATFGVGCTLGIAYFILDLPSVGRMLLPAHPQEFHGLVTDPNYGLGIPFMLAGAILWGICIAVYVGTSLLTPPPPRHTVDGVCWDHPLAFLGGRIESWSDPRAVASVLFIVVTGIYVLNRMYCS